MKHIICPHTSSCKIYEFYMEVLNDQGEQLDIISEEDGAYSCQALTGLLGEDFHSEHGKATQKTLFSKIFRPADERLDCYHVQLLNGSKK